MLFYDQPLIPTKEEEVSIQVGTTYLSSYWIVTNARKNNTVF